MRRRMVTPSWANMAPLSSPTAKVCKEFTPPQPLPLGSFASRALILSLHSVWDPLDMCPACKGESRAGMDCSERLQTGIS